MRAMPPGTATIGPRTRTCPRPRSLFASLHSEPTDRKSNKVPSSSAKFSAIEFEDDFSSLVPQVSGTTRTNSRPHSHKGERSTTVVTVTTEELLILAIKGCSSFDVSAFAALMCRCCVDPSKDKRPSFLQPMLLRFSAPDDSAVVSADWGAPSSWSMGSSG